MWNYRIETIFFRCKHWWPCSHHFLYFISCKVWHFLEAYLLNSEEDLPGWEASASIIFITKSVSRIIINLFHTWDFTFSFSTWHGDAHGHLSQHGEVWEYLCIVFYCPIAEAMKISCPVLGYKLFKVCILGFQIVFINEASLLEE